jgi:hypothetical protein
MRRRKLLGLAGAWLTQHAAAAEGPFSVRIDGEALVLLDAQGVQRRRLPGRDFEGRRHGPPQALLAHTGRRSVIACFPAFDEVWELSLDPEAPPVYDGLVHDWRLGEAIGKPGFFTPRRMALPPPMPTRWFLDPSWPWIAGALDDAVLVVHLDVRRVVARLALRDARVEHSRRVERSGRQLWLLPTAEGERLIDPLRWVPVQPG